MWWKTSGSTCTGSSRILPLYASTDGTSLPAYPPQGRFILRLGIASLDETLRGTALELGAVRSDGQTPAWTHKALQQLVGQSTWDEQAVWRRYGAVIAEAFAHPAGIFVIDDTTFPKQGQHSVGVQGQEGRLPVRPQHPLRQPQGPLPARHAALPPRELAGCPRAARQGQGARGHPAGSRRSACVDAAGRWNRVTSSCRRNSDWTTTRAAPGGGSTTTPAW